jgi:hypothetical protein
MELTIVSVMTSSAQQIDVIHHRAMLVLVPPLDNIERVPD